MSIRYSDYTVEQLRKELGELQEKRQTAEQLGEVNKVAIYERKMQIVSSYMLNPDDFVVDELYQIKGDPGYRFHLNMVNGIMGWGHRVNLLEEKHEKEEALPLAMLEVIKKK